MSLFRINHCSHKSITVATVISITGATSTLVGVYNKGIVGRVTVLVYTTWHARGFIGVAANAVGQGNPLWVTLTTFVFAISDALTTVLQSLMVPTEFTSMLPYVLTLSIVVVTAMIGDYKKKSKRKNALNAIARQRAQTISK